MKAEQVKAIDAQIKIAEETIQLLQDYVELQKVSKRLKTGTAIEANAGTIQVTRNNISDNADNL